MPAGSLPAVLPAGPVVVPTGPVVVPGVPCLQFYLQDL